MSGPHPVSSRRSPPDGLLDLRKIVVTTFELADFKRAVDAAALMQGLDLTAVVP